MALRMKEVIGMVLRKRLRKLVEAEEILILPGAMTRSARSWSRRQGSRRSISPAMASLPASWGSRMWA